jgi:hypothetical protein
MASIQESLDQLQAHQRNLAECTTFEAFKRVQIAFIDVLIAEYKAKLAREVYVATTKWVVETCIETSQENPK